MARSLAQRKEEPARSRFGFTLIELSLVVLVLSLLAGAALRYSASLSYVKNVNATNATLDAIEAALLDYRVMNGRLPCPADYTKSENSSVSPYFGGEVDSSGGGSCTGYNVINSGTDPDAAGGSDNNYGGSADPLYDGTNAPSNVVAGAVPVRTLKLADKYAYDAWGREILYAVDKRITASNAFVAYPVTSSTIGVIVIKSAYNDTLAKAISLRGLYALVSFGANGHGGLVRNLSASPSAFNFGSINSDELKNCHCTSAAASSAFDRIFVQKPKTVGGTTALNNVFDDIVRFKTRYEMGIRQEMQ